MGSIPLALMVLSMAACADSNATTDEGGGPGDTIPRDDAGDDASLLDDGGKEAEVLLPPCANGNLCRVESPLVIGTFASMAGRSKDDVWAGGTNGLLVHWTGQQWTSVDSGIKETMSSIFLTPTELWGVAGALVLRRGLELSSLRTFKLGEFVRSFSGIVVLPNGEAYVSLAKGYLPMDTTNYFARIADFDAKRLEFLPAPVIPGSDQAQVLSTRSMFLVPDKAVWLVGEGGKVARYPLSPPDAGAGPDAGAAGGLGAGAFVPVSSQASLLTSWGHDDHLWVAGGGGLILHFDGAEWHHETSGTTATINVLFGISPSDIWAAGDGGTLLHFDGTQWSKVNVGGYHGKLSAIWGSSRDDVWVAGERAMFHWGALQ